MASIRFSFTNLLESWTLQNGVGTNAPALDEVSPWVTSNVQNKDSGLLWQGTASGNADFSVPGGVGATADVTLFCVLAHRGAPSTGVGIASVEIFTQTGAYDGSGSWTSRGTITLGNGVRDGKLQISVQTIKSVRFAITATTAFTIGRLFVGVVDYDLLIVSSPGRGRRPITPKLENRMGGGMLHLTPAGDERWEYSLPYQDVGATLFAKLLAAGRRQTSSFVMLDRDDAVFEAFQRNFSESLTFDTPDTFTASLELETRG